MMNYLGYLRKRNPAGTPRRTLSHFLVCDSDKKKKCPCKHIFGLVFCASLPHFFSAPRERKELCRLSEAFFSFRLSDFPHARAWGSWDCAAPPALAPATRETPKQIRPPRERIRAARRARRNKRIRRERRTASNLRKRGASERRHNPPEANALRSARRLSRAKRKRSRRIFPRKRRI